MHTTNSRKKFVTAAFVAIAGAVALTGCQSPFSSAEPDYEALESYITDEISDDYSQIGRQASGVDCPRQADTVTSGESFLCTVDLGRFSRRAVHWRRPRHAARFRPARGPSEH